MKINVGDLVHVYWSETVLYQGREGRSDLTLSEGDVCVILEKNVGWDKSSFLRVLSKHGVGNIFRFSIDNKK